MTFHKLGQSPSGCIHLYILEKCAQVQSSILKILEPDLAFHGQGIKGH